MNASKALLQAIAVTAELTATEMSEPAAAVLADDLSRFPEQQVLGALTRCRRELKGRLTIADVVDRLDDGRPGAEEAWAMIPQDEEGSVVWSTEMQRAFGVANPLLVEGDTIAARMAFLESYRAQVRLARDRAEPVCWQPSLGRDRWGREAALIHAVDNRRMMMSQALALLPEMAESMGEDQRVLGMVRQLTEAKSGRCDRLMSDGSVCGLLPPCPDCGRACHDFPVGG